MDEPQGEQREGRHETRDERMDRNWDELLQELRVTQTGVQLLSAFLLTLPFQPRFAGLGSAERALYLSVVLVSAAATVLLVAPVAIHRVLFRHHEKDRLVAASHRFAQAGLVALALAISGAVSLVFTVVLGGRAGMAVGTVLVIALTLTWWAVPRRLLANRDRPGGGDRPDGDEKISGDAVRR